MSKDNITPFQEVTEQQIAKWKKKHGKVMRITSSDGKYGFYIRPIDRQVLGFVSAASTNNTMEYFEVLLNAIMLAGDMECIEDDWYFMGIVGQLGQLIKTKEFELEEL